MKDTQNTSIIDWDWSQVKHTPPTVEWLKQVQHKPISEEEFIKGWKSLPHKHRRAAKCRAKAKRMYRDLNERYEFFS